MTSTYFFILGHSPEISRAEIKAVFQNQSQDYQEVSSSSEAMIIAIKNDFPIETIMKKLGGTVKMGQILDEITFSQKEEIVTGIADKLSCQNLLQKYLQITGEKINFGFSVYDLNGHFSKTMAKSLLKIGLLIKRELKEKGYSVRFVTSREKNLSSVIVGENKLMERGADICFFFSKDKIYLGKTLAIQDYRNFSFRDYGRPQTDAKSGMLPPKLARIMINLSQVKEKEVLLDPFCGSGTILQEALLLGIKKVIGSDLSSKAIKDAKSNIQWLISNFQIKDIQYQISQSDVQKLPEKLKEKVDVIVTEPYLGPPLKGNESLTQIQAITKEVSKLYVNTFQTFQLILKKDGRVVIVLPVFKKEQKEFYLPIIPYIEKMDFRIQKNLSAISKRGGIVYSRPDQKVLREIFVLRK